jgi:hypothetical protein
MRPEPSPTALPRAPVPKGIFYETTFLAMP